MYVNGALRIAVAIAAHAALVSVAAGVYPFPFSCSNALNPVLADI